MTLSVSEMRDRLFSLNLSTAEGQKEYGDLLYQFILLNEGSRATAYLDTVGKVTVGIGFNMDGSSAKTEWEKAFGSSVPFADVYNRSRSLSEDEIRKLFDLNITVRRFEIEKIYQDVWGCLTGNVRVAIEDLYFNAPSLVSAKTNFHRQICSYVQNQDQQSLLNAIEEVKNHSNSSHSTGLQHRRDREAEMLSLPS